jgi:hypothetical protein
MGCEPFAEGRAGFADAGHLGGTVADAGAGVDVEKSLAGEPGCVGDD